ncbi:arabinosylfuranosidase ArfA [Streptosporangium soli]|nr:alpha-N-arabinofuranosidase [Streptosporangium sp. KLBMP 9127]
MTHASLTIDPAFAVGDVDPRLFGSFVEHLGRCVYSGIFEPGHPAADENGFRRDVLDLVRELGVTTVRYPGGNFVSAYRWEDGVGPDRRTRLDPAWRTIEPNTFGLGEFVKWCAAAGVDPMMAVNLGTRGIQEAVDLLEYSNHPSGTALSDLRRKNGDAEPYDIRLWCLGNEMDGPWQVGHKTAEEYGRLAAETARAMRMIDPRLELVACGSSGASMPTFGTWEATVLQHAYDQVDYLSLHAYYEPLNGDVATFLASGARMESFIEDTVATCDHMRSVTKSSKRINLSFDEWNVWYMSRHQAEEQPGGWRPAPRLLEDHYDVTDAVVVGSLLIALLRHADRVRMASQAQLVNVIAPILAEPGGPAWRQTIFHPFAQAALHGKGRVLRVEADSPAFECAAGEVGALHATAVQGEDGSVTIFAVNRSQTSPLDLAADVRALGEVRVLEHTVLTDADLGARNTADAPDRVRPRPATGTSAADGTLHAHLPPVSWNVIRLAPVS